MTEAVTMGERPRDRTRQPTVEEGEEGHAAFSGEDSDGEFEFPFVSRETDGGGVADELFADGRVRAFYPVFGRVLDDPPVPERKPRLGRLFHEESRNSSVGSTSSSSSAATDAADLDGASPESYCLWIPGSSPASSPSRPPRKSRSTGSLAPWRRISDLVVGRSHSDGKEKFLFISPPSSPVREHPKAKPTKGGHKSPTEADTIAAGQRMSYYPKALTGTARRKTFLPYRQDLMGLFANGNGLSRNQHRPF
ncbi:hypothetical protein GUJ93_ZPchr0001g31806 [Zizania palustris]|uniref:Uncharacterized protein n=1 Tax=Zizania palustris TaxID=103762 RepID=A0A8J5S0R5_ZIZPA|nr:hypothetical protein GUJ93_ZPchr0001g31806 [Zizania palustris]